VVAWLRDLLTVDQAHRLQRLFGVYHGMHTLMPEQCACWWTP
jgi:hypothetical protein